MKDHTERRALSAGQGGDPVPHLRTVEAASAADGVLAGSEDQKRALLKVYDVGTGLCAWPLLGKDELTRYLLN